MNELIKIENGSGDWDIFLNKGNYTRYVAKPGHNDCHQDGGFGPVGYWVCTHTEPHNNLTQEGKKLVQLFEEQNKKPKTKVDYYKRIIEGVN